MSYNTKQPSPEASEKSPTGFLVIALIIVAILHMIGSAMMPDEVKKSNSQTRSGEISAVYEKVS